MDLTRQPLSHVKRAGASVRRRHRGEIWAAVREHRRRLVAFASMWLATVVLVGVVIPRFGGSQGSGLFMAGLLVGMVPFFGLSFLVASGIAHRRMGGDAERWTAEELAKLDTRKWAIFHDVPVEYVNVDHVAVGPGRVYAIETKWTSAITRPSTITWMAREAERRARLLQRALADHGVRRDAVPILVVWGPGVAQHLGPNPRGGQNGSARIVAGRYASVWRERMDAAADGFLLDAEARTAIARLCVGTEDGR